MRRVVCAAIRSGEIIICGVRHHDMIMSKVKQNLLSYQYEWDQGFVDQQGVFMDRYEALGVAQAACQLIRKTNPPDRLFSEDLY